ncbi:unnamed protein product [Ixodes pacificus]
MCEYEPSRLNQVIRITNILWRHGGKHAHTSGVERGVLSLLGTVSLAFFRLIVTTKLPIKKKTKSSLGHFSGSIRTTRATMDLFQEGFCTCASLPLAAAKALLRLASGRMVALPFLPLPRLGSAAEKAGGYRSSHSIHQPYFEF